MAFYFLWLGQFLRSINGLLWYNYAIAVTLYNYRLILHNNAYLLLSHLCNYKVSEYGYK